MWNVTGSFKADVPKKRQRALLEKLGCRPGVSAAGLVKEDAKSSDMRLLFFMRGDDGQAESILDELRKHADVAIVEESARRGLA